MRASFAGTLTFGLVNIGVKAYAMNSPEEGKLHWIHADCSSPVSQAWRCQACGLIVTPVKGYNYQGSWIALDGSNDLEDLKLTNEEGNPLRGQQVFPRGTVSERALDRAYYLAPSSSDYARPFYLLLASMLDEEVEAIVTYVMRGKSYLALVSADEVGELHLRTMFYATDMRSLQDYNLRLAPPPPLAPKEVALARQLLRTMRGKFDHNEFQDISKTWMSTVIEAKVSKKPILKPKPALPTAPRVLNLTEALQKSIETVKPKIRRRAG